MERWGNPGEAGMRKRLVGLFIAFSFLGFLGGAVVQSVGCKALSPEAKQNIVNGEKLACALANAAMPDETLKAVCNLASEEVGPILNLVSVHRDKLKFEHAAGVAEGTSKSGAPAPCGLKDAGRD